MPKTRWVVTLKYQLLILLYGLLSVHGIVLPEWKRLISKLSARNEVIFLYQYLLNQSQ